MTEAKINIFIHKVNGRIFHEIKDSGLRFDSARLLGDTDSRVPIFCRNCQYEGRNEGCQRGPPTASKGTGSVTATYDTASKKLSWKGSYKDLSGPATAAHFHSGEVGKNGAVVIPISPNTSPFEGSATLTDAQAAELMAGQWYVNVHTDANKGGEIRGQVTK
jgi:hypothetical protein